MTELDDEHNLDDQQDDNNGVPSDTNDDDQNIDDGQNDDLNDDQGNDDDRGADDDQDERPTRQERRRERMETFNAARENFQQSLEQHQQGVRRDPYNPMQYGQGQEYDVNQLEKDRNQFGESRYAEGFQQARFYDQQERFYDRLESDGEVVANRYSFLDEESDDFDPELAGTINAAFLQAAGFDKQKNTFSNTNIRYKTFAASYIKAMERYASQRNADSGRNLDRQRSMTGIRPTGTGRRPVRDRFGDDPSQLSDEELEAVINSSIPRK